MPAHVHVWRHEDRGSVTWNVCAICELAEYWAAGMLMDSSDWQESERLNEEGR